MVEYSPATRETRVRFPAWTSFAHLCPPKSLPPLIFSATPRFLTSPTERNRLGSVTAGDRNSWLLHTCQGVVLRVRTVLREVYILLLGLVT